MGVSLAVPGPGGWRGACSATQGEGPETRVGWEAGLGAGKREGWSPLAWTLEGGDGSRLKARPEVGSGLESLDWGRLMGALRVNLDLVLGFDGLKFWEVDGGGPAGRAAHAWLLRYKPRVV